mgnify:CR=1 FL=1
MGWSWVYINPDYDLGRDSGSVCDTIQWVGLTPQPPKGGVATLQTTYINEWQKLFVNVQHLKGKNCVLKIFDMNGREVFSSINGSTTLTMTVWN